MLMHKNKNTKQKIKNEIDYLFYHFFNLKYKNYYNTDIMFYLIPFTVDNINLVQELF